MPPFHKYLERQIWLSRIWAFFAMDKKVDGLLKKGWDSSLANLKPAMAATVVARNMECWLDQLKNHVVAGTSRKVLLESFPTLLKAVKYMADATAESIRMSARSSVS